MHIWATLNIKWNFYHFFVQKSHFSSKINKFPLFLPLIIIFWLEIFKESFYGLLSIIFEKFIFCDQNEILHAKNAKNHFIENFQNEIFYPYVAPWYWIFLKMESEPWKLAYSRQKEVMKIFQKTNFPLWTFLSFRQLWNHLLYITQWVLKYRFSQFFKSFPFSTMYLGLGSLNSHLL